MPPDVEISQAVPLTPVRELFTSLFGLLQTLFFVLFCCGCTSSECPPSSNCEVGLDDDDSAVGNDDDVLDDDEPQDDDDATDPENPFGEDFDASLIFLHVFDTF